MKDKLRFSALGKDTMICNESYKFGDNDALKISFVNHKFFFMVQKFTNSASREFGTSSDKERLKSTKTTKQSKKDQKQYRDHSKNAISSQDYSNKNKKTISHPSINQPESSFEQQDELDDSLKNRKHSANYSFNTKEMIFDDTEHKKQHKSQLT